MDEEQRGGLVTRSCLWRGDISEDKGHPHGDVKSGTSVQPMDELDSQKIKGKNERAHGFSPRRLLITHIRKEQKWGRAHLRDRDGAVMRLRGTSKGLFSARPRGNL